MTRGMLAVFSALRQADELELDCSLLAARTGLSKGRTAAAVRDLRSAGLVRSRRQGWRTFVALDQRPVRRAA